MTDNLYILLARQAERGRAYCTYVISKKISQTNTVQDTV
jgi:hypothetical protein